MAHDVKNITKDGLFDNTVAASYSELTESERSEFVKNFNIAPGRAEAEYTNRIFGLMFGDDAVKKLYEDKEVEREDGSKATVHVAKIKLKDRERLINDAVDEERFNRKFVNDPQYEQLKGLPLEVKRSLYDRKDFVAYLPEELEGGKTYPHVRYYNANHTASQDLSLAKQQRDKREKAAKDKLDNDPNYSIEDYNNEIDDAEAEYNALIENITNPGKAVDTGSEKHRKFITSVGLNENRASDKKYMHYLKYEDKDIKDARSSYRQMIINQETQKYEVKLFDDAMTSTPYEDIDGKYMNEAMSRYTYSDGKKSWSRVLDTYKGDSQLKSINQNLLQRIFKTADSLSENGASDETVCALLDAKLLPLVEEQAGVYERAYDWLATLGTSALASTIRTLSGIRAAKELLWNGWDAAAKFVSSGKNADGEDSYWFWNNAYADKVSKNATIDTDKAERNEMSQNLYNPTTHGGMAFVQGLVASAADMAGSFITGRGAAVLLSKGLTSIGGKAVRIAAKASRVAAETSQGASKLSLANKAIIKAGSIANNAKIQAASNYVTETMNEAFQTTMQEQPGVYDEIISNIQETKQDIANDRLNVLVQEEMDKSLRGRTQEIYDSIVNDPKLFYVSDQQKYEYAEERAKAEIFQKVKNDFENSDTYKQLMTISDEDMKRASNSMKTELLMQVGKTILMSGLQEHMYGDDLSTLFPNGKFSKGSLWKAIRSTPANMFFSGIDEAGDDVISSFVSNSESAKQYEWEYNNEADKFIRKMSTVCATPYLYASEHMFDDFTESKDGWGSFIAGTLFAGGTRAIQFGRAKYEADRVASDIERAKRLNTEGVTTDNIDHSTTSEVRHTVGADVPSSETINSNISQEVESKEKAKENASAASDNKMFGLSKGRKKELWDTAQTDTSVANEATDPEVNGATPNGEPNINPSLPDNNGGKIDTTTPSSEPKELSLPDGKGVEGMNLSDTEPNVNMSLPEDKTKGELTVSDDDPSKEIENNERQVRAEAQSKLLDEAEKKKGIIGKIIQYATSIRTLSKNAEALGDILDSLSALQADETTKSLFTVDSGHFFGDFLLPLAEKINSEIEHTMKSKAIIGSGYKSESAKDYIRSLIARKTAFSEILSDAKVDVANLHDEIFLLDENGKRIKNSRIPNGSKYNTISMENAAAQWDSWNVVKRGVYLSSLDSNQAEAFGRMVGGSDEFVSYLQAADINLERAACEEQLKGLSEGKIDLAKEAELYEQKRAMNLQATLIINDLKNSIIGTKDLDWNNLTPEDISYIKGLVSMYDDAVNTGYRFGDEINNQIKIIKNQLRTMNAVSEYNNNRTKAVDNNVSSQVAKEKEEKKKAEKKEAQEKPKTINDVAQNVVDNNTGVTDTEASSEKPKELSEREKNAMKETAISDIYKSGNSKYHNKKDDEALNKAKEYGYDYAVSQHVISEVAKNGTICNNIIIQSPNSSSAIVLKAVRADSISKSFLTKDNVRNINGTDYVVFDVTRIDNYATPIKESFVPAITNAGNVSRIRNTKKGSEFSTISETIKNSARYKSLVDGGMSPDEAVNKVASEIKVARFEKGRLLSGVDENKINNFTNITNSDDASIKGWSYILIPAADGSYYAERITINKDKLSEDDAKNLGITSTRASIPDGVNIQDYVDAIESSVSSLDITGVLYSENAIIQQTSNTETKPIEKPNNLASDSTNKRMRSRIIRNQTQTGSSSFDNVRNGIKEQSKQYGDTGKEESKKIGCTNAKQ
jgi:hypothetical protein